MYSTIVVGTDGSDGAKVAVATAGELAALSGAAVHLVHGYGNPTAMVDPMAGATFAGAAVGVVAEVEVEGRLAFVEARLPEPVGHGDLVEVRDEDGMAPFPEPARRGPGVSPEAPRAVA